MKHKLHLMMSCAMVAAAMASAANAQGASVIEELVVTAEKREQSLQDVPVAVSAFTDERRELIGINSVQDLTNFTPGLSYTTNNDRAAIRGIGRFTNNQATEGGVAMYNDGVFTTSVTAFAQSSLFIERTEVLRGPQGTLYGKNSVAGAMNLISKKPTEEFTAEIRGVLGNYDRKDIEGFVSGPIFGTIRGRLAGSYSSIGKGIFTNLNPDGKNEGGRGDQWTIQGQLAGEIGDGKLEWWLKADTTEWHNLGRGPGGRATAIYGLRDVTSPTIAALTPNSAAFGLSNQLPGNTCQFCFDTDDGNYIALESNGYAFNTTLHLDSFDVKYIAGMNYYNYELQTDLDGTSRQAPFLLPIPARNPLSPTLALIPGQTTPSLYFPRQHNQYNEEVWWHSNELNFTSTHDGKLQWLVGLYEYRQGNNYTLSDARFPDDARFATPTNQAGAAMAPNPLRRYAFGSSENSSQSYAGYGQVDWQATEQIKVTAGLRYTRDHKKSFESARLLCIYTASCPISVITGRPVDVTDAAALGTTVGFTDPAVVGLPYTDPTTGLRHRRLDYKWDGVTGTLGLDWQPDDDTLAFAKFTRGYKAGGFNAGTTTLNPRVSTEEENIDSYEIGLKRTFGGNLQVNASAFYYDYKNIQVPITGLDPVTQLNVTSFFNMPKAKVLGFEVESIWQPIDNLQVNANYSYLNSEIREGCCFQDPDDPRGLQPGAVLAGNTPAQLAGTGALNQDLKGQALPSSTPHRFTINTNYTWNLGGGDLSASASYVWRDGTYYSIFNRYYNFAKSYGQTDFRLLFRDTNDRYTLIGSLKNVFDTRGNPGVNGTRITTGPNIGFVNRTISYVPPRTYTVEVQYRF
jgi:iron complex outermembrane recepter protein